jgi:tetratricopeptide (TPR) repeat protein
MAQALVGLDRLDEARELLEEAISRHRRDPFLALALARVLRDQGRSEAARDQYVRALGLEPNLEDAKQELAELEEKEGE